MRAQSAATKVRSVSSEKSLWPGVSSRLYLMPPFSKRSTELVTEMPRSCSIAIQSESAAFPALRDFTAPASRMAPP